MFKDYTTREQRLNKKELYIPSLIDITLIITTISLVSFLSLYADQVKLNKCIAFNNNNEAVADCFTDN